MAEDETGEEKYSRSSLLSRKKAKMRDIFSSLMVALKLFRFYERNMNKQDKYVTKQVQG